MKAEEMFEKLDYEYSELLSDDTRIYYEHKNNDNNLYNQPSNFIMFDLDYKVISSDCDITLKELQAINKQVEELGWNNVASNR